MTKILAFHNDKKVRTPYDFIKELIHIGKLRANLVSGEVFNGLRKMATVSSRGYIVGTVHLGGQRKQIKAHQVVWYFSGKQIPTGLILDHRNGIKTDNRIENLRLVTAKQNSHNRRSYMGENNPASKLNNQIVEGIRNLWPKYSYGIIANLFRISKSSVAQIIRGETWKS